jgi:hypothetical protein
MTAANVAAHPRWNRKSVITITAHVIDVAVEVAELREAVRERHREQEGEQHLHARQRHTELVEQLDQLSVVTLVGALRHARSIPARPPA